MPATSADLKNSGLIATYPRLKILELLQTKQASGEGTHLTADDIHRQLMLQGVDIGQATIYRALTQFEQAGLLKRHHFDNAKAAFELNRGTHHDHLVCLECGRIEEFLDDEIEQRQARIARDRGFVVRDHSLYLFVECVKSACPHRKSAAP